MKTRVSWLVAAVTIAVITTPLVLWTARNPAQADPPAKTKTKDGATGSASSFTADLEAVEDLVTKYDRNELQAGDRIGLSPAGRRLVGLLHSKVSAEFCGIPMTDALQRLAEKYDFNVVVDNSAITAAGRTIDVKIDVQFEEMKLATFLDRLLDPHGLTYDVRDEYLVITALDALAQQVTTRAYYIPYVPTSGGDATLSQRLSRLLFAGRRAYRFREIHPGLHPMDQEPRRPAPMSPAPTIEIFGNRVIIAGTLEDHEHLRELLRLIFGDLPAGEDE